VVGIRVNRVMRHALVLALGLASSALATTTPALSNGRFPRAQRLLEQHGDPERLVLAATYGLLVTADRGGDWRHICELGFAFTIDEIDPLFELPADGSLLVQAPRSLNRSPAPYCSFEPVLGGTPAEMVADFSLDRVAQERVLALRVARGDGGGPVNRLYESNDSGKTFEAIGTFLPEDTISLGLTVDAAPSDPERVYVTAIGQTNGTVFARSDDRGTTWTATTLPVAPGFGYLAAVHPTDPDILYVRTDGWIDQGDGTLLANDALFYSDDGGESFHEILRGAGKLFGFALSPDGSELIAGYGDPVEAARLVDPAALGIFRASADDYAFVRIFAGAVSCLTWSMTGVYACTSQTELGYALGFTERPDFDVTDPDPFTPLLDLARVNGPLDCPACSSGAVCQAAWADSCAVFGNCDAGVPAVGGGGGTSCTPGASGEGGMGGQSESPPAAPPPSDASCGCRTANADPRTAGWLLALVAGAFGRRRVRR